jgi:hypothetical protein
MTAVLDHLQHIRNVLSRYDRSYQDIICLVLATTVVSTNVWLEQCVYRYSAVQAINSTLQLEIGLTMTLI